MTAKIEKLAYEYARRKYAPIHREISQAESQTVNAYASGYVDGYHKGESKTLDRIKALILTNIKTLDSLFELGAQESKAARGAHSALMDTLNAIEALTTD